MLFKRFFQQFLLCTLGLCLGGGLAVRPALAGLTEHKTWGLATVVRSGKIIYAAEGDTSTSFVPLLFFEGKCFYLDGVEAGLHLYDNKSWGVDLLSRLRFFEASSSLQREMQGDAFDSGARLWHQLTRDSRLATEFLFDVEGRWHGNLRYAAELKKSALELSPYVNLRLKSAGFNSYYYALEGTGQKPIAAAVDLQIGSRLRYHLTSNLYVLAGVELGLLDAEARRATAVDSSYAASAFAGFGFFNQKSKPPAQPPGLRPWLRLAYGFSTPSSIGDILSGSIEDDPQPNVMTSIFLGLPLSDKLFDVPLDIYLTPGLALHHQSSSQKRAYEYVAAIKGFYRIPWPTLLRIGLGTGFSWISEISTLERRNNESKGYKPSHFLHFIDVSLDLNLGHLVRYSSLKGSWLGAGVHHRSAIFETAQQYGRIKGGSNYPMIYLQVAF